ncbi:MAG TPA: alpha/beta hydrolase [Burkholderiaceae bacterium]|nr:alpha/beta hydrolase [Burkholderiaceae bacterium]
MTRTGFATTDDGVRLYTETTGEGEDLVFVHEFAGDCTSWEPQVRHFARRYRCTTYNARGWPPSDVPPAVAAYSQRRAVADLVAVMDGLGIARAHVVGLSMGGFATLHLGLSHPGRARSLVVAGVGYGAEPSARDHFRAEADASAALLLGEGMQAFVDRYSTGPTRVQFENKDPRGFAEFKRQFATHSALGSANTQLGVQRERPSLYDLAEPLSRLEVPTLIVNGDEDWPCLAPGLMLKRTIPAAALVVLPHCGHTMNLEAPDAFNREVESFLGWVDSGRWPKRDPRAMASGITGMVVRP